MTQHSPLPDTDELLKHMASESVKQGENLRNTVRDLTLQALKTRELSLDQIKSVLRSVTEGVNLGAARPAIDAGRAIKDAVAGMDDAVAKAVHASHLALQQLAGQGQEMTDTHLKRALDDLKRLEGEFFDTIQKAAEAGMGPLKQQWTDALKHVKLTGTDTGANIAATMEDFSNRMVSTMHESRHASLKAAQTLAANFAALTSGILIGLSEALTQHTKPKD
jgi:hypothetical protein